MTRYDVETHRSCRYIFRLESDAKCIIFIDLVDTGLTKLVCGETESIADLLHRLNAALGKAAAENIVIDEVLPEIKRRR